MSKVSVPTKCSKCGSEQIRHEILRMYGRHGGRRHLFDVYMCRECGYTELFFKE